RTDVVVFPATTWALVTIRSGAGENPLPASRTPQARPLTRTVDAVTWATRGGGRVSVAGVGAGGSSRARRLPRTSRAFEEGAAAAWVRAAGAADAGPASTMGTTRKRDRNRATAAGRRRA